MITSGYEGLQFGVNLEDACEQRTAVQISKDRTHHDLAHGLPCRITIGFAQKVGNQFAILEQKFLQALAFDLGVEIGLHGRQDGCKGQSLNLPSVHG